MLAIEHNQRDSIDGNEAERFRTAAICCRYRLGKVGDGFPFQLTLVDEDDDRSEEAIVRVSDIRGKVLLNPLQVGVALDAFLDAEANREALDEIIAGFFRSRNRAELEALLLAAAIAFGAVNSVLHFSSHPQLRRTPVTLESGEEAMLVASPIRTNPRSDDRPFGKVPRLGEHSAIIRQEFTDGS